MKFCIAAAAGLILSTVGASAQDGAAFLAKLGGSWTGSGTITTDAGAAPGQTTCRLNGSPSGASVTISGSCDGAAKGAQIYVVLRWSAGTQQFVGTFQGALETGTATLTGRLSGQTLLLAVSSANGGTGRMSFTLAGDRQATLRVSGKGKGGKPVDFVTIGLRKA